MDQSEHALDSVEEKMGDEMGSKETARLWDVRPVTVWPFSSPSDANQVVSIKRQSEREKRAGENRREQKRREKCNCTDRQ